MNTKLFNIEEIRRRLIDEEGVDCHFFYCETVDSTNDWAKREGRKGVPGGAIYLAERQTAGKGRRGRIWHTAVGTSVSMSILLRPDLPADKIFMLTLVMGMAVVDGIRRVCDLDIQIKWPNDVIIGGKKICGILTEMSSGMDYVVIGIGINVNVSSFSEELAGTSTSLFLEQGRFVSREFVTVEILNSFWKYYKIFMNTGDISAFFQEYQKILVNRGRSVRVLDPAGSFCGMALGINGRGELLVKREDNGATEAVYSGEVSVRGLYSYL